MGNIIDCHGHVKWYGYTPAKLVENMDAHGIARMWLLSWECAPEEMDLNLYGNIFWPGHLQLPFEHVMEAVEQYPDRFIPGYAPDPRQPGALKRLQGAVQYLGARVCGELKCRVMMDDPHALEMFYYCGEAGLPVVFHMDVPLPRHEAGKDPGNWYCCDWENLARALECCPKTIFIGHAPGFWREISGNADDDAGYYPKGAITAGGRLQDYLDRYPNLYCDLSAGSGLGAVSRDPEAGKAFLVKYQDRCLFGRDYFDDALYRFLIGCDLPEVALAKILRENALRLVPVTSGASE
ncbi:MAG: Amidohydrolase [bacterium ADurb.Bin429]|nr:MAG: Amidohydrolase [bacterium ADurb.Bin429]